VQLNAILTLPAIHADIGYRDPESLGHFSFRIVRIGTSRQVLAAKCKTSHRDLEAPPWEARSHANRHTFITNLCKAEISPKTVQTLARHGDIRLTMNLYSHVDLEDQSAAISKLPGITGKEDGRAAG